MKVYIVLKINIIINNYAINALNYIKVKFKDFAAFYCSGSILVICIT